MKFIVSIATMLLLSFTVIAQDSTKKKEIGITFRSLDSFGLTYRFGTEKALWRVNGLTGQNSNSSSKSDSTENVSVNSNVSLSFGREFRKPVGDKFEFRYGADVSIGYAKRIMESYNDEVSRLYDYSFKTVSYTPGVNLVLGFNYLISDAIVLGAELNPNFSYTIGENVTENDRDGDVVKTTNDITTVNYGLSSNSLLLSLAYRF